MATGQLPFHCQPEVSPVSGEPRGLEATIRWRDSDTTHHAIVAGMVDLAGRTEPITVVDGGNWNDDEATTTVKYE